MIYITESLLSILLIGSNALIGYRAFNWALSSGNIFFVNGIYLAWFIITFLLAYTNGATIYKFIEDKKILSIFSNIVAIAWDVSIIAIAIYVWFKPPYSTGLTITRVIWSYLSLGLAAWLYIMINLMHGHRTAN